MTSEERENLDALCRLMQEENDPEEFQELLIELNHLLSAQERRIGAIHVVLDEELIRELPILTRINV